MELLLQVVTSIQAGELDVTKVQHATWGKNLAISRIRGFSAYGNGWDGHDGIAPTQCAIEQAEEFARYLFTLGKIVRPHISLSGDGEINFYWKEIDFTLDLGLTGDGTYSYYARLPGDYEIVEDEARLDDPLPKEITDIIAKTA